MAKNKRSINAQAPAAPVTEEAVMQEQEQLQEEVGTETEQVAEEEVQQTPAESSADDVTEADAAAEAETDPVAEKDYQEEPADEPVQEPVVDTDNEVDGDAAVAEPVTVEVVADPSVNWTVPVKTLVAVLDDYEVAMAPGRPQTVTSGELQQRALYRVLIGALSLEGADFTMAMDEICRRFVAGAAGVYSESHALRFFEHLVLDTLERQRFRLLVTTFQTLADPKSREVQLRFLDLATVARTLPDLGSQQRLLAYFRGA